jgi:hypothetical protein
VEEVASALGGEMTDVTLFRRVPATFGGNKKFDVVTGLTCRTTRSPTPSRQFCYLEAGNVSARADR